LEQLEEMSNLNDNQLKRKAEAQAELLQILEDEELYWFIIRDPMRFGFSRETIIQIFNRIAYGTWEEDTK
jgi:hypothetical protein